MDNLLHLFRDQGDYTNCSFDTGIGEESGKNIGSFQSGGYYPNRVQGKISNSQLVGMDS
jgi:hypothetical protein